MKKRSRLSLVSVVVLLLLSACFNASRATPTKIKPLPSPTATSTQGPTAPPTSTATPSTPVATARPLVDSGSDDGIYVNDVQGVSLEYPPTWMVEEQDTSSQNLLTLSSRLYAIWLFLFSDYVPDDTTFEDYSQLSLDNFITAMGLFDVSGVEYGLDYELPSGEHAWRGVGSGIDPTGLAVDFEMLAVQRGVRTFEIVIYRYTDYAEQFLDEARTIADSLETFAPRPYGVERDNALFLNGAEPDSFDPAKWAGSADSFIGDIFSGLVRLDTSLQPIPDLARDWDISEDGTVYTFHLREGVKFHDGKPFTARDVVYSWEHALKPETGSHTALTYLGDIVGAQEYAAGEADTISGVRIIDDYTLEVTLDGSRVYFLLKLSYPVSWIVDAKNVTIIDQKPNGTGPFRFVQHDENEVLILERNANYYLHPVALEYVVYLLTPAASMQFYETGDIDIAPISKEYLSRAEDPDDPLYGNVHEASRLCTTYLAFNSSKPPFDDPAVRRAFAQAIDKDWYNELFLDGEGIIADGLFPPGLPGYNPDVSPLAYDADAAARSLAESSYGSADALPPIKLTTVTTGGEVSQEVNIFIESWRDVLGVSVGIDAVDVDNYQDMIYSGNYENMVFWGWCADCADPENFADILFHTGGAQNISQYSNPDVDALLDQARTIQSVDERMALYQEIEQMLIDDAAAAFLTHSEAYYIVTREGLMGYQSAPIGVAQNMNLYFEREGP